MEPDSAFQMVTFLEPQIADIPPLLGFPNLNLDNSESSRWDSDISDSCPPSPSPLSSPSPHSSASSSESGIEDSSDMEEAISTVSQTANGPLVVKMENPPSPLNALNPAPLNMTKKRRKGHKKTRNGSDVLEELNKLLVETTRVSLTSALGHSQSPIFQSPAQISGLGDNVKAIVQTTASPTSVSYSCPQSVQVSQTTTVLPSSHHVSVCSQSTSTLAIPKLSTPPPVASPSKVNNKNTNPRKRDEPKIVIIEEPEEVFALNISENLPDHSTTTTIFISPH